WPGRPRHRAARSVIRRAEPEDRAAIESIVRAAYAVYIPRIGKPPGPMLDDYAALIADGNRLGHRGGGRRDRGADRAAGQTRPSAARQHRRAAQPAGPRLRPRADRLCRT